ncbi:MAG: lytic transglycosylase domain-containing protein [Candidatus Moranbacteria bacterium]|nr:lytic transglycosylase domain-containing protein [Candidatus Moranbacteria bacterium]
MKTLIILISLIFSTCSPKSGHPGNSDRTPIGVDAPPAPTRPPIDTDASRKGFIHLRKVQQRAEETLRARNVESRAYPGESLADVYRKHLSGMTVTTTVIEHVGMPNKKRKETPETVIRQVLEKIGREGSRAYATSTSYAGARGNGQLMRSTYLYLRNLYPNARLNPSFQIGASDEVNAAMATMLHYDATLAALTEQQRNDLRRRPELMREYVVAAYNGSGKAKKALESGNMTRLDRRRLAPSTTGYLKKYTMSETHLGAVGV